jgi:hypothetical protein
MPSCGMPDNFFEQFVFFQFEDADAVMRYAGHACVYVCERGEVGWVGWVGAVGGCQ